MIDKKDTPEYIFEDFLEGLIALDEEEKKEENIHPMFRGMEGAGGIHFWQLQQYIVELAYELLKFQAEFDELEKEWATHKEYWGRYLGPVRSNMQEMSLKILITRMKNFQWTGSETSKKMVSE